MKRSSISGLAICRALAGVLVLAAGCDGPKPAAPAPPAFPAARGRFLDALNAFEAHLWDPDGTERRKALAALDAEAVSLAGATGRPANLPDDRLSLALGKLNAEAHAFSNMIGRAESTGRPPESGLPWPYEYRESAAQVRTLLGAAPAGR